MVRANVMLENKPVVITTARWGESHSQAAILGKRKKNRRGVKRGMKVWPG